MKSTTRILSCMTSLIAASCLHAAEPKAGENPAEHLPPHITQVTWFGERAEFSHDGKKILFLSKTFGDALEIELATKRIRNLTAHYAHHGYTRALYLANGDILLSGPEQFDPKRIGEAHRFLQEILSAEFWIDGSMLTELPDSLFTALNVYL